MPVGSREQQPELTADIVIITVQYRNFQNTREFVTSLANLDDSTDCELIIVDNDASGASAGDLDLTRQTSPFPVHVLRPSQNLYYWGGAEFALAEFVSSQSRRPRWTIICNNDVTFLDRSFLTRLRSLDASQYPVVAPTIISETTGADQNPFLVRPAGALKRLKWRVYDVNYGLATTMLAIHGLAKQVTRPLRHILRHSTGGAARQQIYAPHGSFVILSEAFFERGGGLDTTIPMFAEELTIAVLAQRLSIPIWHLPDLRVSHREHSTTGARLTRAKYELERQARRHYYDLAV